MKNILTLFFITLTSFLFSQPDSVKNYYKKIVFGSEFNQDTVGERKWKKDIKIFVIGDNDQDLISELNRIVKELNTLINPVNITVVKEKYDANVIVLFGSKQDYINLDNRTTPYLEHNEGLFIADVKGREIISANMYVNTKGKLTTKQKKHLLREELTQLLGLCNDSYLYNKSIFYQGWTDTTEYADIDKELIKMLYNN